MKQNATHLASLALATLVGCSVGSGVMFLALDRPSSDTAGPLAEARHELVCTVQGTPTFELTGAVDAELRRGDLWIAHTETMTWAYRQMPGEACGLRSGR